MSDFISKSYANFECEVIDFSDQHKYKCLPSLSSITEDLNIDESKNSKISKAEKIDENKNDEIKGLPNIDDQRR